ncbi:hypothetical protein [Clostridium akagii]|uniref:hypothetical protein n=1 Tax=Clostridium akagii TaxID=91623 RepID=UPI00047921A8|nr:hypothetical protein [Clostridium akagii]
MAKYDNMIQQKKDLVLKRKDDVEKACQKLMNLESSISYCDVSKITNIPLKTLQGPNYKEIIKTWQQLKLDDSSNRGELHVYKKEIAHLKEIIHKLIDQNSALKTEIYRLNK